MMKVLVFISGIFFYMRYGPKCSPSFVAFLSIPEYLSTICSCGTEGFPPW